MWVTVSQNRCFALGSAWRRQNLKSLSTSILLTVHCLCVLRSQSVDDAFTFFLKSGDSSVVTRWTVDQEVVGSNPTHGIK